MGARHRARLSPRQTQPWPQPHTRNTSHHSVKRNASQHSGTRNTSQHSVTRNTSQHSVTRTTSQHSVTRTTSQHSISTVTSLKIWRTSNWKNSFVTPPSSSPSSSMPPLMKRLLELPWAVHELVHGVLQHMCATYAHAQVLHHGRVDSLKQSLQATSLSSLLLLHQHLHRRCSNEDVGSAVPKLMCIITCKSSLMAAYHTGTKSPRALQFQIYSCYPHYAAHIGITVYTLHI